MIENNIFLRINKISFVVKNFVELYYPFNYGVMITGSCLTQFFNEESDVDVIILSNLFRKIFIESREMEGYKIQSIVLPVFDLESVICKDKELGGGVYIHQLSNGVILRDPMNLLRKLKTRVQAIYDNGPRPLSRFYCNQLRSRITTRYEDLKGSNNIEENLYILFDLYPKIIELFFSQSNQWKFQGKSAYREIIKLNPEFNSNLIKGIVSLIKFEDRSYILNFVSDFLDKLGGEMHFSSTREVGDSVISNILVIYFSMSDSNVLFQSYITVVQSLITRIKQTYNNTSAVCYHYQDNKIYNPGIYIICSADCNLINEQIIPLVEMFQAGLYRTGKAVIANDMQFPYLISPMDIFGDVNVQHKLISIFDHIRNICPVNGEFDFCIYLLDRLRSIFPFNKSDVYKYFLETCCWFFENNYIPIASSSQIYKLYISDMRERFCKENANLLPKKFDIDLSDLLKEIEVLSVKFDVLIPIVKDFSDYSVDYHMYDSIFTFYIRFIEALFNVLNVKQSIRILYYFINTIK